MDKVRVKDAPSSVLTWGNFYERVGMALRYVGFLSSLSRSGKHFLKVLESFFTITRTWLVRPFYPLGKEFDPSGKILQVTAEVKPLED